MSSVSTMLLPFEPSSMSTAQLAAVSFLARYSGRTHALYTYQLKRWFAWCEGNGLDPLVGDPAGPRRAVHPPPRRPGLMDSSIVTMMHGVRGYFRFAHIDGLIPPTQPSTPGCRRCSRTSRALKGWTAWS